MAMLTPAQTAEVLRTLDDAALLAHRDPDSDTIGAAVALCAALRRSAKRARVLCSDPFPERYAYLNIGEEPPEFEPACYVAVDVADPKLLGRYEDVPVRLCIDHHPSNRLYARDTCLVPTAAATCEILFDILALLGAELDPALASALYSGIAGDTGCFRFTNTTARTHEAAAALMKAGAHAGNINRILFEQKPLRYYEIERRALESLQLYAGGQCACIAITREMKAECGATDSDLENISSLPRSIEGVRVGITLREQPDGRVRVSVRSVEPIDASVICAALGGGGHARAAGCELSGPPEAARERVLAAALPFLGADMPR